MNNIGLMSNGDVRLFDFGHSSIIDAEMPKKLPPQNLPFAAPEIVLKEPAGLASDWWSYGIVAAILFQGQAPYEISTPEVEEKNGYPLPEISDALDTVKKDFISSFLQKNPKARPTNPSTHDLFKNMDFNKKFKPPKMESGAKEADEPIEKMIQDIDIHLNLAEKTVRIPSEDYFKSVTSSSEEMVKEKIDGKKKAAIDGKETKDESKKVAKKEVKKKEAAAPSQKVQKKKGGKKK